MTVTVVEHEPTFNAFTDEPITLQIFTETAATLMTTFEDGAIVNFPLVAKQDRENDFPFFTEHFTAALLAGG